MLRLPSYSSSKKQAVQTHTHTNRLQYPRYAPTHSEVNNIKLSVVTLECCLTTNYYYEIMNAREQGLVTVHINRDKD